VQVLILRPEIISESLLGVVPLVMTEVVVEKFEDYIVVRFEA
jgi:hypothetical protein